MIIHHPLANLVKTNQFGCQSDKCKPFGWLSDKNQALFRFINGDID